MDFDWTQAEPQPHPISAVCTRRDPEAGLLIAALGHEKAMAWGEEIIGLLYRETSSNIVLRAESASFNPPGGGSVGVSAVWPERDLVFMATGTDGFRAYVVNPSSPSITLHRDCQTNGFATNIYSTANAARCLRHFTDGSSRRLIVGSTPGLLVGEPTLNIFSLDYPDGVVADGNTVYVTGWSGKVQRLGLAADAGPRIQDIRVGAGQVDLTFFSPFGGRVYQVEATPRLWPAQWSLRPDAQIHSTGKQSFTARLPSAGARAQFYRIRVRP